MVNLDQSIAVNGDHNITGYNLSNVGNVTFITVGASDPLEKLESKVAFGALLNSEERYPAPYFHPDTPIAELKLVKDWIARKGDGSEKSIVWISGGPKAGKTALLQTVCVSYSALTEDEGSDSVDIEDDKCLIDACYFFHRKMGDRGKASFPATIAYQLVQSRASWADAIVGLLAKKPPILLESFTSQFRKLVLRPAKVYVPSEAPLTIVIDGLDKCDNVGDQVALLDVIFEAATTANIRFVIASKPKEDIQAVFQRPDVSCHTHHIRLQTPYSHQLSCSFRQSTHPEGPPATIHPAYYQAPPMSAPAYAFPPTALAIHPLLDGENPPSDFTFNLSLREFTPLRYMGNQQTAFLTKEELDEVATDPAIIALTIECDLIPLWPIKVVWASNYTGLETPPLTVAAILCVVWKSLQVNITHQEWAVFDDEMSHKVSQAYTLRCKRMAKSQALAKDEGVKRVDFLLNKVYFKGLVQVDNALDKVKLIVDGP